MYTMFHFETPLFHRTSTWSMGRLLLVGGTVLWLILYVTLGWVLFQGIFQWNSWLFWLLLASCIGVGVACGLGWWRLWRQSRQMHNGSTWKALSLEQMYKLTPSEFEEYVAQRVFARRGYTVINTPDVKDGGVDILVEDRFGKQAVVQCKRYRGVVGEAIIRDLYGTMIHFGATHAYLFATGAISSVAYQWVKGKPITLVDGEKLVEIARAALDD